MSEDLLPIGRFARLCRLSVKQLRHYDDLGLLTPAWVDPGSGYRYYRRSQARTAMSIGLLRSLDVPLVAIGRVLSGDDPAGALGEVRDRMEADLARRRRTLAALDRVLADGLPRVEVTVLHEPARRVRVVRDTATPSTIAEVTGRCVARLLDELGGAPPTGLLLGLFPQDLAEEFTVGVAAEAGDAQATDVLPGGVFAVATHVGPYDQIDLTGHGLLAWCGERGHLPVGPIREVYLTNPADTPPERLVTQLMIRLEDAP
ncbi:DNA-binding transcriptional regulator, MerR family [Thermomonospora echinospora]|uniref:DNA-binding transcriptional regulator, MerR family n=1 Tax=Thermomonospora echinospora TaxID=1992 RepID=A0A1H6CDK4_9ACTN|nr:MerR family transcriptional regulator [Thermomonospora echinospora]SEG71034.1 DNA-binding transcriptional regulator, MerR family [Thermomonospora echinospora]